MKCIFLIIFSLFVYSIGPEFIKMGPNSGYALAKSDKAKGKVDGLKKSEEVRDGKSDRMLKKLNEEKDRKTQKAQDQFDKSNEKALGTEDPDKKAKTLDKATSKQNSMTDKINKKYDKKSKK